MPRELAWPLLQTNPSALPESRVTFTTALTSEDRSQRQEREENISYRGSRSVAWIRDGLQKRRIHQPLHRWSAVYGSNLKSHSSVLYSSLTESLFGYGVCSAGFTLWYSSGRDLLGQSAFVNVGQWRNANSSSLSGNCGLLDQLYQFNARGLGSLRQIFSSVRSIWFSSFNINSELHVQWEIKSETFMSTGS